MGKFPAPALRPDVAAGVALHARWQRRFAIAAVVVSVVLVAAALLGAARGGRAAAISARTAANRAQAAQAACGGCEKATDVCQKNSRGEITGVCVACNDSNDCDGRQVCYQNACRNPCSDDGHCADGQVCSSAGACVSCRTSADCTVSSIYPICYAGRCVACAADSDCATGAVCHAATHTCADTCTNTGCPDGQFCDRARNICAACLTSADCGGSRPLCSSSTRTCVECEADAQCSSYKAAGTATVDSISGNSVTTSVALPASPGDILQVGIVLRSSRILSVSGATYVLEKDVGGAVGDTVTLHQDTGVNMWCNQVAGTCEPHVCLLPGTTEPEPAQVMHATVAAVAGSELELEAKSVTVTDGGLDISVGSVIAADGKRATVLAVTATATGAKVSTRGGAFSTGDVVTISPPVIQQQLANHGSIENATFRIKSSATSELCLTLETCPAAESYLGQLCGAWRTCSGDTKQWWAAHTVNDNLRLQHVWSSNSGVNARQYIAPPGAAGDPVFLADGASLSTGMALESSVGGFVISAETRAGKLYVTAGGTGDATWGAAANTAFVAEYIGSADYAMYCQDKQGGP